MGENDRYNMKYLKEKNKELTEINKNLILENEKLKKALYEAKQFIEKL